MRQIWTPLRINHLQVSYEVGLEAHDIPRPKSGDLLVNRFWLGAGNASFRNKYDSLQRFRSLDVAKWLS